MLILQKHQQIMHYSSENIQKLFGQKYLCSSFNIKGLYINVAVSLSICIGVFADTAIAPMSHALFLREY